MSLSVESINWYLRGFQSAESAFSIIPTEHLDIDSLIDNAVIIEMQSRLAEFNTFDLEASAQWDILEKIEDGIMAGIRGFADTKNL